MRQFDVCCKHFYLKLIEHPEPNTSLKIRVNTQCCSTPAPVIRFATHGGGEDGFRKPKTSRTSSRIGFQMLAGRNCFSGSPSKHQPPSTNPQMTSKDWSPKK